MCWLIVAVTLNVLIVGRFWRARLPELAVIKYGWMLVLRHLLEAISFE
jgi:hypothetical protein